MIIEEKIKRFEALIELQKDVIRSTPSNGTMADYLSIALKYRILESQKHIVLAIPTTKPAN